MQRRNGLNIFTTRALKGLQSRINLRVNKKHGGKKRVKTQGLTFDELVILRPFYLAASELFECRA